MGKRRRKEEENKRVQLGYNTCGDHDAVVDSRNFFSFATMSQQNNNTLTPLHRPIPPVSS
jgi:hypothetical protein